MILAFDVYGTLFHMGVIQKRVGEEFAALWRRKQLEYTWLLAAMGRWMSFREVTKMALQYVLARRPVAADPDELLSLWERLEPFGDVEELKRLAGRAEMYCLTNADRSMVKALLERAGLAHLFKNIYTAEDAGTFKPSPKIYRGFLEAVGGDACLVSSNSFDVAGAKNAGMCAIYLNREGAPLEMGVRADYEVATVKELVELVGKYLK